MGRRGRSPAPTPPQQLREDIMAETITTAPYEIVLRFGCEVGGTPCTLCGSSLAQLQFMVDEAGVITGRIDRGKEDLPQAFPQDQIVKYLGEQMAGILKQYDDLRAQIAALANVQTESV